MREGIEGLQEAFLALPETLEEELEFEATLLEGIVKSIDHEEDINLFAIRFLESYCLCLTESDGEAAAADPLNILPPRAEEDAHEEAKSGSPRSHVIQEAESHINSLYAIRIQLKQAEIREKVARGATPGKIKKKRNKRKAREIAAASVAASKARLSAEQKTLEEAIIDRIKQRGREKWRNLAKIIKIR